MRNFLSIAAILCLAPAAFCQESGLICGGAEPFWALEFNEDRATFSAPDVAEITYDIELRSPAEGRITPVAITLISRRDTAIAILAERACNDTMSDIIYTHSLELLTQRNSTAIMYSGCCRMRAQ